MYKKIMLLCMLVFLLPLKAEAMEMSAVSSILINAKTREIIFKQNSEERLGMASTTKIMTALIALEEGNTTDIFTVSSLAQNQEGSSIYLRTGEKMTLSDLLYGLMLNSGNDAAVCIAEGISGSCEEFVQLMNEKAREIGCINTHFANPNGLSDNEHYSTAYDMAMIMAYAMENDEFRKIVSTREYKITTPSAVTYLRNHNKLLWRYPFAIGGKTGYTKKDGRCFVSVAEREGAELVAVTLNDKNDWRDHEAMFDFGFDRVKNTKVISKNEILCTRRIRGQRVNILAGEELYLPLNSGSMRKVTCKIKLDTLVNEEFTYGTQLGYGEIYVGDFMVGSIPLVSGQSVKKPPQSLFVEALGDVLEKTLLKI